MTRAPKREMAEFKDIDTTLNIVTLVDGFKMEIAGYYDDEGEEVANWQDATRILCGPAPGGAWGIVPVKFDPNSKSIH